MNDPKYVSALFWKASHFSYNLLSFIREKKKKKKPQIFFSSILNNKYIKEENSLLNITDKKTVVKQSTILGVIVWSTNKIKKKYNLMHDVIYMYIICILPRTTISKLLPSHQVIYSCDIHMGNNQMGVRLQGDCGPW